MLQKGGGKSFWDIEIKNLENQVNKYDLEINKIDTKIDILKNKY